MSTASAGALVRHSAQNRRNLVGRLHNRQKGSRLSSMPGSRPLRLRAAFLAGRGGCGPAARGRPYTGRRCRPRPSPARPRAVRPIRRRSGTRARRLPGRPAAVRFPCPGCGQPSRHGSAPWRRVERCGTRPVAPAPRPGTGSPPVARRPGRQHQVGPGTALISMRVTAAPPNWWAGPVDRKHSCCEPFHRGKHPGLAGWTDTAVMADHERLRRLGDSSERGLAECTNLRGQDQECFIELAPAQCLHRWL